MNILDAIERLKQVALEHPDAVVTGYCWTHECFFDEFVDVTVQTSSFDGITRVYFEHDDT